MLRSIPLFAVLIVALLPIGSCKAPTAPEIQRRVTISHVIDGDQPGSVKFEATLNFDPGTDVKYVWVFDGVSSVLSSGPSIEWIVSDTVLHHLSLSVRRQTDNAVWATGTDSVVIRSRLLLGGLQGLETDSAFATVLQRVHFKALLGPKDSARMTLQWIIDGIQLTRINSDTASWAFGSPGSYPIAVYLLDTLGGKPIDSAKTQVTVKYLPVTVTVNSPIHVLSSAGFGAAFSTDLPWSLKWRFGDGTGLPTSNKQASHVYQLAGRFTLTATVSSNGVVLGTDTEQVSVLPGSGTIDASTLRQFTHGEIRIDANFITKGDGGCYIGPDNCDYHSISFESSGSWADTALKFSGNQFWISLSPDGSTMVIAKGESSRRVSDQYMSAGTSTYLGLRSLQLIWATDDSVRYGRLLHQADALDYSVSCAYSGRFYYSSLTFSGVDWSDSTFPAMETVTLKR